ncbi:hypothetical protein HMPREF0208_01390 [Citrobacter koseri]|nr:hypothetical protein HMPREF3207_02266 [Citrobacter koseri]KXA03332.1 hypothetical protein HMPREF3220_00704 [Citrobacter koseri]KXB45358.1 hypothetical protein HMPREF0208_01390 [Citrobacter koseri]
MLNNCVVVRKEMRYQHSLSVVLDGSAFLAVDNIYYLYNNGI